jgi:hypothetical protein
MTQRETAMPDLLVKLYTLPTCPELPARKPWDRPPARSGPGKSN